MPFTPLSRRLHFLPILLPIVIIPGTLDLDGKLLETWLIIGNLTQTAGDQVAETEGHMIVLLVEQVVAVSWEILVSLLF